MIAFFAATVIAGATQPRAKFAGLPTVIGKIQAVSDADVHAAVAEDQKLLGEPISFIRIVDRDTIQLHHEQLGDRCEHYCDMRRKKGKWIYRATVVRVEGCDYRLM
jgi:hypothetical protein